MTSRRATIQPFGLSFLDVIACSLGAVVFLLMQTANRTHEQATVYDNKIANLDKSTVQLLGELTKAKSDLGRANGAAEAANRGRAQAEDQRDRANAQADQANDDLKAAERARAEAEKGRREAQSREADATANARRARDERDRAQADLENARNQLENLSGVVGLKGDMKNVVFVFDTSESMKGDRFQEYKDLLGGWVLSLQFKSFSLISFNYDFHVWPESKKLMVATPDVRSEAVELIGTWKAVYTTNTLEALEQALAIEGVDTIVLLSDGQPNLSKEEALQPDPQTAEDQAIIERATQRVLDGVKNLNTDDDGKPRVTINTVAMGNYLNKHFGTFLQDLARQNKGEFIGR